MAGAGGMPTLQRILAETNSTSFSVAARDFYSDVMGFVHAVDWSERWLLTLLAFHSFVWMLVILTRKWNDFQMAMLVIIRAQSSL